MYGKSVGGSCLIICNFVVVCDIICTCNCWLHIPSGFVLRHDLGGCLRLNRVKRWYKRHRDTVWPNCYVLATGYKERDCGRKKFPLL
jgi:hypothetical protein